MDVLVSVEHWELRSPFRITGREWHHSSCIVVELRDGDAVGYGEAQGVSYFGETADSLCAQVVAIEADIDRGIDRDELKRLLPRGGARNAVDCARLTLRIGYSCAALALAAMASELSSRPIVNAVVTG